MEKKEQLYEGKAKKVYATEDPNLVIVSYKDDATAFDGAKKGTIVGKGVINNQMTNRLMAKMEKAGIPTHFVEELSERDTLVDFKLEFGKTVDGQIVLADEISPDTCRLWDSKTNEKLDKDRFRRDLGGVEDAYAEVMKRLMAHDAQ